MMQQEALQRGRCCDVKSFDFDVQGITASYNLLTGIAYAQK